MHASGFGGACTGGPSFYVYLSDRSELAAAIVAAGAWLVSKNMRGEIDIVIPGMPVAY